VEVEARGLQEHQLIPVVEVVEVLLQNQLIYHLLQAVHYHIISGPAAVLDQLAVQRHLIVIKYMQ
jgi:hypothetical protein